MTQATVAHIINGALVDDTGRTQTVTDPADLEITKRAALASTSTIEKATSSVADAFKGWRATQPAKKCAGYVSGAEISGRTRQ